MSQETSSTSADRSETVLVDRTARAARPKVCSECSEIIEAGVQHRVRITRGVTIPHEVRTCLSCSPLTPEGP